LSNIIKISGKKFTRSNDNHSQWTFEIRPGGWMIATSAQGVRRRLMIHENRGKISASTRGFLWAGEWVVDTGGVDRAGSESDLVAQFPGKVRKLLVTVGAQVQEGDSLLLVEAMKMEFAIRAPFSGVIKNILVKEGQQLLPGDRFVDLEILKNG
jgi:biotin carboxyl carrier protein